MGYIIFNGWNSSDDLIITRPLIRPTWGAEVTEVTRPGAPRKIMQVSDSYANENMTIEAAVFDATPERIHRIYQALSGYGQLVLSSSPQEILTAYLRPIIPEAVALQAAAFALTATLQPFAYSADPTTATLSTAYSVIINQGTVWSAPEIRFTPSAVGEVSLDINGQNFVVNIPAELVGKEIIVDSDVQVTYYEDNGTKVAVSQYTKNNYPLLHTGSNVARYTGSVTGDVTIDVRERWL